MKTRRAVCSVVFVLLVSVFPGCGQRIVGFPLDRPEGGATNGGDADVPDGADGHVPDADFDDGDVIDAAPDDEGTPRDGGGADGENPDASLGDGAADDGAPVDGELPDSDIPDSSPPCGNGVQDVGEECDPPGITQNCTTACGSTGQQVCLNSCLWSAGCAPLAEICNGVDDNCDGLVDEGLFGVQVPEIRVTVASGSSQMPAHVWAGSQFSMVWGDNRGPAGVFFNGLDAGGTLLYGDSHLSDLGNGTFAPDVDHTATGTVVVWDGGGVVYFTRVGQTGNLAVDPPVLVSGTAGSYRPSVASAGVGAHGTAWTDARDGDFEIYFAVLDDSGAKLVGDVRVTDATGISRGPSLVFTGSEFGLAWMDARDGDFEIYFVRIGVDGTILGNMEQITDNAMPSVSPSLAWNSADGEYGLSWMDALSGFFEIYFTRISAQGVKNGNDIAVSTGFSFLWGAPRSLAWSGQFFGLVWEDLRYGSFDVFFTRLTPDGTKLDNDIRVTTGNFNAFSPYLRWNGAQFGIAWTDLRHGGYGSEEIYFSSVGCP